MTFKQAAGSTFRPRGSPTAWDKSVGGASDELSPIRRAQSLLHTTALKSFSLTHQKHVRRVASATILLPPLVTLLDQEWAPFKVCRWVAWGKWHQDRVLRLGVALYLREEVDIARPGRSVDGWAWSQDHRLASGLHVFQQTPQHTRLVKAGVLREPSRLPAKDAVAMVHLQWASVWAALQEGLASLDRAAFLGQVKAHSGARKRRRARKRVVLGPKEVAYVDALNTLRRGLLRGDITAGELAERVSPAGGPASPAERRRP